MSAFALFSGGHDSLCSTHLAMESGMATEVVHVNTGIGIAQTREFVRQTCEERGWKLNELHPPVSYEDIVREHGFPGPGSHRFMYIRLKERCLRAFAKERGRPITFVTGVRSQESSRRMGHVKREVIDKDNRWTWYAPICDFTKRDVLDYLDAHRVFPRNEVVDILHMSGECLCGSFARPGEREEIRAWYPEVDAQIAELEMLVALEGHPAHRWGRRPDKVNRNQTWLPLCHSCVSNTERQPE